MSIVIVNNAETNKNEFIEFDDNVELNDFATLYGRLKDILNTDSIDVLTYRMIQSYTRNEDGEFVCLIRDNRYVNKCQNKLGTAMCVHTVCGNILLCKFNYHSYKNNMKIKGFDSIEEAKKYLDELYWKVGKYIYY